jgi:serine/threonine protein kinase
LPFDPDRDSPPSQEEVHVRIQSCRFGVLAKHLLEYLLKVDPSARPTSEEAMSHPWFTCKFSHDALAVEISSALKQWEQSLLNSRKKASSDRWADMDSDDEDSALGAWGTSQARFCDKAPRWADILSDAED